MIVAGNKYKCTPKFAFDGDSLNLDFQGEQSIVRLQWIDCCETQKPGRESSDPKILAHWKWAQTAKFALLDLIKERQIIAFPSGKDQYSRWICDLYIDRVSIASNIEIELCRRGLAVVSLPYNKHQFSPREVAKLRELIRVGAFANQNKVGLWSEPGMILPREIKKLTW